ncbi:MAG: glycogen synthase GlgA [Thermodesulfobacteriota bacterium]
MKLFFVVSEMVPFAKTGGLADVAGALPDALMRRGIEVRVFIPCYRAVRKNSGELHSAVKGLKIPLGGEYLAADVLKTQTAEGVPVYALEREDLYERPNLYGASFGDYYDNLERFVFFSRAALQTCTALTLEPDVIHCHDWQAGLIPLLLRETSLSAKSVFTIHNLGYQGLFPAGRMPVTGLDTKRYFHPEGIEYWDRISLLKAGIVYADRVTTVSPTYAEEIQTPEFGMGMEGVMQARRASLFGILNGADYTRWDPETDTFLPACYGPSRMAGKAVCKKALLQEAGLDSSLEQGPVIGLISRLDHQKGIDLVVQILDDLLSLDVCLVILGAGDKRIEEGLRAARERHGHRMALRIGFDEALAHRIMAGADILLVPSRYEPCGLTQMYAMKYGTIPVARATGGLEDTVSAYNPRTGAGNGFKFAEARRGALLKAVRDAVALFYRRGRWEGLRKAGMAENFSWDRSAGRYEALFRDIMEQRGSRPRQGQENGPPRGGPAGRNGFGEKTAEVYKAKT